MFIKPPRGKTLDELYQWCLETAEIINREHNETDIKKENKMNGDKKA